MKQVRVPSTDIEEEFVDLIMKALAHPLRR